MILLTWNKLPKRNGQMVVYDVFHKINVHVIKYLS